MVERSRYACTTGSPRERIVYTRYLRHPPPTESEAVHDETEPSQLVAEPSQTQLDSQTAPTHGRGRGRGQGRRGIRRALTRLLS